MAAARRSGRETKLVLWPRGLGDRCPLDRMREDEWLLNIIPDFKTVRAALGKTPGHVIFYAFDPASHGFDLCGAALADRRTSGHN
jgi:hypothetical protein